MYFEEIEKSMTWLGKQKKTLFLGQSIRYPGTACFNSIKEVPMTKRLELPVIESSQMGITIGLGLQGFIPVSIFPRLNFLLCAMDPLVNFLDKISEMSEGGYIPKVIIRTVIGSEKPLFPGHQHIGDYSEALKSMLRNVEIIRLDKSIDILPAYQKAYNREDKKSTLLIEWGDDPEKQNV